MSRWVRFVCALFIQFAPDFRSQFSEANWDFLCFAPTRRVHGWRQIFRYFHRLYSSSYGIDRHDSAEAATATMHASNCSSYDDGSDSRDDNERKKRKSRNIFADSHPTSTKRHVYFYRFANHQHQHRRRRRRSGKFRYKFDARKKFFEAGYLAPTTKYITIMRSYLFWTSCSLFDFALHPLGRLQRTDTRQILNIRC